MVSDPLIRTQLPMKAENVQCPNCEEPLVIELPERTGETRSRFCPKCGNSVHIHRTTTGDVHIGGKFDGPNDDWARFLNYTGVWVEPASVIGFISIAVEVFANVSEGTEKTTSNLKKLMIERIASERLGFNLSMVSSFIKILLQGGAFQFPQSKGGWKIPFVNTFSQSSLFQAYIRGAVRRLKTKFTLTTSDSTRLCELLLPVGTVGAKEAVELALADTGKTSNEGLTEE